MLNVEIQPLTDYTLSSDLSLSLSLSIHHHLHPEGQTARDVDAKQAAKEHIEKRTLIDTESLPCLDRVVGAHHMASSNCIPSTLYHISFCSLIY